MPGEEVEQAAPREEAQVRRVEQPGGAVPEFTSQQLGDDARVSDVRHGEQDAPSWRQQRRELLEHTARVAQVLEHVGADDGVVGASRKLLPSCTVSRSICSSVR
jgi:hypothetical protein